jgi:hypothetical protein
MCDELTPAQRLEEDLRAVVEADIPDEGERLTAVDAALRRAEAALVNAEWEH